MVFLITSTSNASYIYLPIVKKLMSLSLSGRLVFERIKSKATYIPKGSSQPVQLPGNYQHICKHAFICQN